MIENILLAALAFIWVILNSLQTVLVIKGLHLAQIVLSFVVAMMWVLVVRNVITGGNETMIAYAIGVALAIPVSAQIVFKLTRKND